jgi:acetyltransferase-like isoleucine patch superfamily enzyme
MAPWVRRALLRTIQLWDRLRLARLRRCHPGLEIDPAASTNLASARYALAPGARLRIAAGVVTERLAGKLCFHLEPGAEVEIGEGTWLRTELGEVHVVAFAGARLRLGPECFLNASHVSAKCALLLGRRVWVGPGSRILDSDQHDYDKERPERSEPVRIDDHVWIASDCTVLRGVHIGEHSIVGARSLVTRDVPPHTLALGAPAEPRGSVGDRSRAR